MINTQSDPARHESTGLSVEVSSRGLRPRLMDYIRIASAPGDSEDGKHLEYFEAILRGVVDYVA